MAQNRSWEKARKVQRTLLRSLLGLSLSLSCSSAPKVKPIQFISENNCWYQKADVWDWKCQEDADGSYCKTTPKEIKATWDGASCCWQYKVKEGVWESRCQDEQLERYKREGCKFRRISPDVVAVACP